MQEPDSVVAPSATGDAGKQPRNIDHWNQWTELICVVLLGIASLAAAWSGYQAARWCGELATRYSEAGALRIDASRASTAAYLYAIADLSIFNGWAEANASGDESLVRFYQNRFSPELEAGVEAWLATNPLEDDDAPSAPFELPEYTMPEMARADELEARAEALFDEGTDANQQSDEYVLNTVFLATVLFFAGLATKVTWFPARLATLAMAAILLFVGLGSLLTFPVS